MISSPKSASGARFVWSSSQLVHSSFSLLTQLFGTERDYWVVECKVEASVAEEDESAIADPMLEPVGTGANTYTYYVSNSPEAGVWKRLPPITPEQIQLCRQSRRFLSGHLESAVLGFPRFRWSEASYVRATIARITASAHVAPRGKFTIDAEDEEGAVVLEDEEYAGASVTELATTEGWVHARAHLLRQGRTKPYVSPEAEEDEDGAPAKREEEDNEEPIAPLTSIAQDEAQTQHDRPKKLLRCWTVRISPRIDSPYAVAAAKSLLWPGAVSVARNGSKDSVFLYAGWGHKYLGETYTPPPPPALQDEWKPNPDAEQPVTLVEQEDPLPPADESVSLLFCCWFLSHHFPMFTDPTPMRTRTSKRRSLRKMNNHVEFALNTHTHTRGFIKSEEVGIGPVVTSILAQDTLTRRG